ncbi:tyrosine-type recombinase/integrase [Saccharothrix luteola]|uniref:tyrosine-type recombinase/integrase n=1 Tax=Saccharothrix luteola TaxID=2893018 RepID=UPI001E58D7B2|nr:site-specific integrase [Saccharothrix luteola]MCC8248229.1 site-specific integrase [Saccharothrix luteola]
MGRRSNGESTIYHGSDGYWHGRVTVGVKDNGKPDRRHVQAKTRPEVVDKVRKLEQERDAGKVRKTGKAWTVEKWLTHWLENIVAPPAISENAFSAYEVAVRVHLIPGIGKHRIDKLEPEHLEKLYRKMMNEGAKPGRVHQVHRTIRAALNIAVRRTHITENPVILARAPKLEELEVEPYTVDEVKRLLEAAQDRRNSARWAIALALGLRQGEALGLRWSDVDLETGALSVRRSRLRPKWKHGCTDPCGRKFSGHCPDRIATRPETAGTKSKAGTRGIGLPDELMALLTLHKTIQDRERKTAGQLWTESGYVFITPTGAALNPRTDWTEWKRLVDVAKVPDGRLHDARHTAATVLLLLGIPERTVMGIMGWSNTAMATRYQHITTAIKRDVSERVGTLLWGPS